MRRSAQELMKYGVRTATPPGSTPVDGIRLDAFRIGPALDLHADAAIALELAHAWRLSRCGNTCQRMTIAGEAHEVVIEEFELVKVRRQRVASIDRDVEAPILELIEKLVVERMELEVRVGSPTNELGDHVAAHHEKRVVDRADVKVARRHCGIKVVRGEQTLQLCKDADHARLQCNRTWRWHHPGTRLQKQFVVENVAQSLEGATGCRMAQTEPLGSPVERTRFEKDAKEPQVPKIDRTIFHLAVFPSPVSAIVNRRLPP